MSKRKSRYSPEEWIDFALNLCRGSYQRALVSGSQCLSGADLEGKARLWSGRYTASRTSVINRCKQAGIPIGEIKETNGRRRLVIAGKVL